MHDSHRTDDVIFTIVIEFFSLRNSSPRTPVEGATLRVQRCLRSSGYEFLHKRLQTGIIVTVWIV